MLRFTRVILVAVVLVFGQVWVNLPAHLVKAEPNSYTLSGMVVEETEFGNSVPGASVNLSSLNGGTEQVAVSDTNGAYEFTSLSEGIYRLQVVPAEDTVFRYTSATVEVIEDTQFDLVVRESESSKARVQGKALINKSSPGEYYKDLSLVGVGKLNPNALTGKFSISVPKGIHELRQVYQSGYWLVNRGMIESRPSVNATEDLYLVINAELDADALDYVVHFTDQCNNPLPFTELTVRLERRIDLSNFGISARMLYNPQNNPFMVADENGTAHFPLNPGIGRLDVMASYADGANNAPGGGFNEETLLVSGDRTATVKITLDECLASGDTIAPQVQGSVFDASSPAGWYNQPVAINWEATDPEPSSGAATQPPPTFADQEGVHQYTSGESCDPAGNCAAGTHEVKLDTVRPTFQFKRKHIRQLLHGVFSGRVTDATSGIESVVITNGKRTLSSLNGDITLTCSEDGLKCDWAVQIRKLQHLSGKNTQLIVTDKAGNQRTL